MRVAELMTKKVSSCKTSDSLSVAAKSMWDGDCGAVPVLGAEGTVKGMITDRDICMACFTRDKAPSAIQVQDAMSNKLYSCHPESSISDAEQLMRKNQVRRIPIVDHQGRLAGVLSLADIAREAGREKDGGKREIESEEVIELLGSICQPQGQARAH